MIPGLKGNMLPESHENARTLELEGKMVFSECVVCKLSLADLEAASTRLGWLETQISGVCEPCFEELFRDSGEEE